MKDVRRYIRLSKDTSMDDKVCFGEHGLHELCNECPLRRRCQRFTAAEKQVSIRHKGKYTGKGKERRRERY